MDIPINFSHLKVKVCEESRKYYILSKNLGGFCLILLGYFLIFREQWGVMSQSVIQKITDCYVMNDNGLSLVIMHILSIIKKLKVFSYTLCNINKRLWYSYDTIFMWTHPWSFHVINFYALACVIIKWTKLYIGISGQ